MGRAEGCFLNGLLALSLSLLVWRLTGNFYAWGVLFGPGAALVIKGFVELLRNY